MAKTLHLTIAQIGKNLYDGEALSVTFPGAEGVFEVLANHEALVSPLKAGKIEVKKPDASMETFEVPHAGIAEISANQATILL